MGGLLSLATSLALNFQREDETDEVIHFIATHLILPDLPNGNEPCLWDDSEVLSKIANG